MLKILSFSEARTTAAALIDQYAGGYRCHGRLIAEALDGASSVLLATAGVTNPSQAREVRTALWETP